MREVWRWGINPEEPAYKRTILLSLPGQEDPICAVEQVYSTSNGVASVIVIDPDIPELRKREENSNSLPVLDEEFWTS